MIETYESLTRKMRKGQIAYSLLAIAILSVGSHCLDADDSLFWGRSRTHWNYGSTQYRTARVVVDKGGGIFDEDDEEPVESSSAVVVRVENGLTVFNVEGLKGFAIRALKIRGASLTCSDEDVLPQLEYLDVGSSELDSAFLKWGAGLRRLRYINLQNTTVTDDYLALIGKLPNISVIGLSGTPITGVGFEGWDRTTNIRAVDLSSTALSREGLRALERFEELQILKLNGVSGIQAVTSSLSCWKKLVSLDIGGKRNDLEAMWSLDESSAAAISVLNKLRELRMSGCSFEKGCLGRIGIGLRLTLLDVANSNVENRDIEDVCFRSNIEALRISGCVRITDDVCKSIAKMPGLVSLDLASTNIGDNGMRELSECKSLRTLIISRTKVSKRTLDVLRLMPSLTALDIDDTELCREAIEDVWRELPSCTIQPRGRFKIRRLE